MTGGEFAVLVAAGGIGAALRFLVDRAATGPNGASAFPLGILIGNGVGSFVLGGLVAVGDAIAPAWLAILGIGLVGGFTTFSTMAVDTVRLARAGRRDWAWLNLVGSFVACVAAAGVGGMLGGLVPLG